MRAGSSPSASGSARSRCGRWRAFRRRSDSRPIITSGVIQGFGTGLAYVVAHHRGVRHAACGAAQRRRLVLQSDAQHRQQRRHFRDPGVRHQRHHDGARARSPKPSRRTTPGADPAAGVLADGSSTRACRRSTSRSAQQASWIAYLHAFHLMMILTLVDIPLIAVRAQREAGRRRQTGVRRMKTATSIVHIPAHRAAR